MGASGRSIVSHAFCTSTSRMALRETCLCVDLEPRVATSQTVATPYLREVRTGRGASEIIVGEKGLGSVSGWEQGAERVRGASRRVKDA